MERSIYCGRVANDSIGKRITVCGWVHSYRDHGHVIFVDLRDREGILQIVFQYENEKVFNIAKNLHSEYVISVNGFVRRRPHGTINTSICSGNIELIVDNIDVLNTSNEPPFKISNYGNVNEELRLEYRYLDLRRLDFQKNFIMRHKISMEVRNFLNDEGFLEIETPFLTKSTPEGARDFLVPSRFRYGNFFALPQSPQLFKQILMISGFDKYYQFARCFRDEDLRSDRQFEFTQIDVEMSFVNEEDVMNIVEKMFVKIFNIFNLKIKIPFKKLSYNDAMLKYGSDKPDTRFKVEIKDFTEEFKNVKFDVFSSAISSGKVVRGLCIPNGAEFSKNEINNLKDFACKYGASGLSFIKVTDTGIKSNIAKYFKDDEIKIIVSSFNAKPGDLIVFISDDENIVTTVLGALRLKIGEKCGLIDKSKFNFLWIVDFPLVKWDKTELKWQSFHHPFTAPKCLLENINIKENIGKMKSRAYDIILNGVEIGGGSIRIHKSEIQRIVFDILDVSDKLMEEKFNFLLKALSYGAPPHGGIALGFDRLCATILNKESIREVIAFPKTQKGIDVLFNTPDKVSDEQLKELGLNVVLQ